MKQHEEAPKSEASSSPTCYLDAAHDALNRMRRAHDRGTGCHLTAEMVAALGLTFLTETWEEPDPRLDNAPHEPRLAL